MTANAQSSLKVVWVVVVCFVNGTALLQATPAACLPRAWQAWHESGTDHGVASLWEVSGAAFPGLNHRKRRCDAMPGSGRGRV